MGAARGPARDLAFAAAATLSIASCQGAVACAPTAASSPTDADASFADVWPDADLGVEEGMGPGDAEPGEAGFETATDAWPEGGEDVWDDSPAAVEASPDGDAAGTLDVAADVAAFDAQLPEGGAIVLVAPNGSPFFQPSTVIVSAGGTVEWRWQSTGHTVTSGVGCVPDGRFCSPSDQSCANTSPSPTASTYEHTFAEAGTYSYYCGIHCLMGMVGQVIVQ